MRRDRAWLSGVLLVGAAAGCFEAVAELNEAQQVAEALTRSVRFDGGEVLDGNVPEPDATEVSILPPSLPTVMSPGQVSVMGFDTSDASGDSAEPEASLMQFEGSRKHIRVEHAGRFEEGARSFEHGFEVRGDVCEGLCDKRHPVKLTVALGLRDGRVSRRQVLSLTLDCTGHGDPDACERNTEPVDVVVIGPGIDAESACDNAVTVCGGFALTDEGARDVQTCVNAYECVRRTFTEDPVCVQRVDALWSCLGEAADRPACSDCGDEIGELVANCEQPTACEEAERDAASSDGPSTTPDPIDGTGLNFTGSLREDCAMLCAVAAAQGCTASLETCPRDCDAGLAGTACEQPVVDLLSCIYLQSDMQFVCGPGGEPMLVDNAAGLCPEQEQALGRCLAENPDLLPVADAGPPPMAGTAGSGGAGDAEGDPDAGAR